MSECTIWNQRTLELIKFQEYQHDHQNPLIITVMANSFCVPGAK